MCARRWSMSIRPDLTEVRMKRPFSCKCCAPLPPPDRAEGNMEEEEAMSSAPPEAKRVPTGSDVAVGATGGSFIRLALDSPE